MFAPTIISRNSSINKFRYNKETKESPLGKYPKRILINIGSRSEYCKTKARQIEKEGGVVLNHPSVIPNASDKVRTKELFNLYKVPTPNYALATDSDLVDSLNLPLVAKLKKGSGGEGMLLLETKDDIEAFYKDYAEKLSLYFIEEVFQPIFSKNYEFRVICFPDAIGSPLEVCDTLLLQENGISLAVEDQINVNYLYHVPTTAYIVRKKIKKDAIDSGEFGRNISSGNGYFTSDIELPKLEDKHGYGFNTWLQTKLGEISLAAITALSLDFGAVDIIFDSDTMTFSVLEVNTAFSLEGERSSDAFQKTIMEYMSSLFYEFLYKENKK